MGIRQNKVVVPDENTAVNPEVQNQEETKVETPVTETETKAVAPVQQAAPPAVQPAAGAIPTIMELLNKWDAEELGNTFPSVTGEQGALYCKKRNVSLGDWIDIQVYSHSDRYMVVPISDKEKDPEVKPACRPSYDGKTVFSRETGENITVAEYAESIKGKFPKGVKVQKYHDIFCAIFGSHKSTAEAKAAGIVQVQVSPTAIGEFNAYSRQANFRVKQGILLATHQNCLRIVADPHIGDNSYVLLKFEPCPLDVLANYTPILE